MRIAVLVAHRLPSLHYAETVLPRGFSRIGMSTWVLTSDLVAPSARAFVGIRRYRGPDEEGLNVIRFPSLGLGNLALPDPASLTRALSAIRPDVILSVAPTKGLPFYPFVFGDFQGGLFAQVGEHLPARGIKATMKRWIYSRIFERAKAVFASKDESEGFLRELLARKVDVIRVFLPFDEKVFYYDPAERERVRAELGIEDPLVISAARITPYKGYEALIDAAARLDINLMLVGMREGDRYCESLSEMARERLGRRFMPMPFSSQESLRPLFNAADIGVWTWTSVAIKQALGTGLPVVIWRPKHLIEEGVQGYFIDKATDVRSGLEKALSQDWDREALARLGQEKYSSVAVATRMKEIMESRLQE